MREVFVRCGYYNADQLAEMLAEAAGRSPREAKKVLTRVLDKKPRKQPLVLYGYA